MNSDSRADMIAAFEASPAYRHAYVRQHIPELLAAQIRAMREQREWTQQELGNRADMKQARISRLEDPGYGSYTIETLTRLADAFDVALTVKFSTFSELIDWTATLTPQRLAPASFDEERMTLMTGISASATDFMPGSLTLRAFVYDSNVAYTYPLSNDLMPTRDQTVKVVEKQYASAA